MKGRSSLLTVTVGALLVAAFIPAVGSDVASGQARDARQVPVPADPLPVITGASVGIPQTWSNVAPGQVSGTSGGRTTGDTWFNTWADDGNIYATSDDSQGFLGTCKVTGGNVVVNELNGNDPSELRSPFVNCMTSYGVGQQRGIYHDGRTWKNIGIIAVDGTLYLAVARQVDGAGGYPVGFQPSDDVSIIKSTDHGRTWTNSFGTTNDPNGAAPPPDRSGPGAAAMFPGTTFATPAFIQYGRDDNAASTADGGDRYVFAISNDGFAYDGSHYILGRVPRSKIGDLHAADWRFYTGPAGGNGMNPANWSGNASKATHILAAPHQLSQASVQYIQALHSYVLASSYFPFDASWPSEGAGQHTIWAFYEAPHPWGPWTRFFSEPATECYFGCSTSVSLGWYDPAFVSKFITMHGLGNVVLTAADFGAPKRPNDFLYKLHAFPVTLTSTTRRVIDDASAVPVGTSNWPYNSSDYPGYYDDSVHYSNTAGSAVSYTFVGTSIAWVGGENTDHGYAEVSIDGGPPTSVDTYAPHQEEQQILFEKDGLSDGRHTITITVTSQKDAASTGIYQDVDALIVGQAGRAGADQ
ncbi:MAG: hypothetical protein WAL72_21765 [Streptosporangiaceae bacterium]